VAEGKEAATKQHINMVGGNRPYDFYDTCDERGGGGGLLLVPGGCLMGEWGKRRKETALIIREGRCNPLVPPGGGKGGRRFHFNPATEG